MEMLGAITIDFPSRMGQIGETDVIKVNSYTCYIQEESGVGIACNAIKHRTILCHALLELVCIIY